MSKMYNIPMKTSLIALGILAAMSCNAVGPRGPRPHRPSPPPRMHHPMPPPRPMPPAPHHRHSFWVRGGSSFWPGFTGALVGSMIAPAIVPPPPPPPRPIVYVRQTWVPPVYESRPVYDVFGNIIRYEQVMIAPGYWK